ncbi:MAG: helix-turn-helix domain-containing protein [Pyrinomonadaceae bacterium MAG19_C2-C3]|nr:helix-turn-helix domain-containing protein [Pyrinomonadaceae bacterium MAG19_C2-C3]
MIEVRINQLLKKQGHTLYWLAKETGISYLALSNLAKGNTSSISFSLLESVCQALKCGTSDVLDYIPPSSKNKSRAS